MSPSTKSNTLRACWRRHLRLTGALLFFAVLVRFAACACSMHRLGEAHGVAEEP